MSNDPRQWRHLGQPTGPDDFIRLMSGATKHPPTPIDAGLAERLTGDMTTTPADPAADFAAFLTNQLDKQKPTATDLFDTKESTDD